jgi:ABC-2 type transport system permease protein
MIIFFITPTSFDGLLGTIMESLSVFQRYAEMFSGVFAFGDIVFFISVAIFFLFLNYQMVEKKRWNQ